MKKLFPLLLALLSCWACNIEDTFTQTNVQDMVTVHEGVLYSDSGYPLNVVEDGVGADKWKIEGARYFAQYDILNRNLDIRLHEVLRARIDSAAPYNKEEDLPTDPVTPLMQARSGGYLNLGLGIEKAKDTNCAHPIFFRFEEAISGELNIYIVHEGNSEDSAHMDSSLLETENRVYSIPLDVLPAFNYATLVTHVVATDANGNKKVIEKYYEIR